MGGGRKRGRVGGREGGRKRGREEKGKERGRGVSETSTIVVASKYYGKTAEEIW